MLPTYCVLFFEKCNPIVPVVSAKSEVFFLSSFCSQKSDCARHLSLNVDGDFSCLRFNGQVDLG